MQLALALHDEFCGTHSEGIFVQQQGTPLLFLHEEDAHTCLSLQGKNQVWLVLAFCYSKLEQAGQCRL